MNEDYGGVWVREYDNNIIRYIWQYRVPDQYRNLVRYHASKRIEQMELKLANIETKVYETLEERKKKFPLNAYTQMITELAMCVYIYGPTEGPKQFDKARKIMNDNPKGDDGGSDVPGFQIDVKGSYMEKSQDFFEYALSVAPSDKYNPNKEKFKGKPESLFVLALCKKDHIQTKKGPMIAHLIGWCWDCEIHTIYDVYKKVFKNKFILEVKDLHPMREFPDKQEMLNRIPDPKNYQS